jgi:hypothetical protein
MVQPLPPVIDMVIPADSALPEVAPEPLGVYRDIFGI